MLDHLFYGNFFSTLLRFCTVQIKLKTDFVFLITNCSFHIPFLISICETYNKPRFLLFFCFFFGSFWVTFDHFCRFAFARAPVKIVDENLIPSWLCFRKKNVFDRRGRERMACIHIDVQLPIAARLATIGDMMSPGCCLQYDVQIKIRFIKPN